MRASPNRWRHLLAALTIVTIIATGCAPAASGPSPVPTNQPAILVASPTAPPAPATAVSATSSAPATTVSATSSAPASATSPVTSAAATTTRPSAALTVTPPAPAASATPGVVGAATTVPSAPTAAVPTTSAPAAAATFSAERAYAHVKQLAEAIGSRPSHTERYRDAAAYVARELRSYGYTVAEQQFTYKVFEDLGSSVVIAGPSGATIDGNAFAYAAAGDVTAPLVAVGLGRPEDFAGTNVRGRIALVKRGEIFFRDKVANAAAAGASGVIIYNNQNGPFGGTLGSPADVPAIAIDDADGRALAQRLERGPVELRLIVKSILEDRQTTNVIGTGALARPNTSGPVVVVGGHVDSVEESPGANDNASGIGTMLEIARVAARGPNAERLVFIGFGAEEDGLYGSRHYVAELPARERRRIALMINLDMVGVGDRFEIGAGSSLARGFAERGGLIARGLGWDAQAGDAPGASDHTSFAAAEIPAVFLHWREDPNYHSPGDVAANVRPDALEAVGRTSLGLIEVALVL